MTSAQELQRLVAGIYSLDKGVRYAGFVGVKGEVSAGGMKEGTKPLDSVETEKLRLIQIATSGIAKRNWEQAYGKYFYTLMRFERLILTQFPFGDMAAIVSIEPNAPIVQLCDKIGQLLAKGQ